MIEIQFRCFIFSFIFLSFPNNRCGVRIHEHAEVLIQYLPQLWEISQHHNLLRGAVVNVLNYLVQVSSLIFIIIWFFKIYVIFIFYANVPDYFVHVFQSMYFVMSEIIFSWCNRLSLASFFSYWLLFDNFDHLPAINFAWPLPEFNWLNFMHNLLDQQRRI